MQHFRLFGGRGSFCFTLSRRSSLCVFFFLFCLFRNHMTKLSKSHPSLHCTRLYTKSRGVRGGAGRGQPKAWLEPGTRRPGPLMTCCPNKTPVKPHLLLISKMQLFCSEKEDTIQGKQTTDQQLAISRVSMLGQSRDVP